MEVEESLKPMHLVCQDWAHKAWDWDAVTASAHPIYRGMKEAEGAGMRTGPEEVRAEVYELDAVLARSDPVHKGIIVAFYIWGGSTAQKAKRLKINRTDFYQRWRRALEYLKGRFHERGIKV